MQNDWVANISLSLLQGAFQHINASGFYVTIDCCEWKETFGSIQHCANQHFLAGKQKLAVAIDVTSFFTSFLPFFLAFFISVHAHMKYWNVIHILAEFQLA